MTRRIVIAMVINVWLVLITAGTYTYFVTRSLLIADLDQSIVCRVGSLQGIERPASMPRITPSADDEFVIKGRDGRTITSLATASTQPAMADMMPRAINATFSFLDSGQRLRVVTVKAYAEPAAPGAEPEPVTVVYYASAEHIDTLMHNLLYAFVFFAALAAVATALAAHSVARAALKPMRVTADVIGAIDERSLHRRIEVEKLPSELVSVGKKLNDMLARLETAFTQRRQFLADASHELRTPVAALVTTLEVALRRPREAIEYAETLQRCLTDAHLLQQLVVALIEQARMERFGRDPEFAPLAISSMLRECVRVVEPLAQNKGLWISYDLPDGLIVLTDEHLLRSAVGNLLSNAVEYTPANTGRGPGKITLSVRLKEVGGESPGLPTAMAANLPSEVKAEARHLEIRVRDNGPGIPAEHLKNVFEPFFRVDAAREHPENHLGLGLALVSGNVKAMAGLCRVESPPRGDISGCEFILELPTVQIRSENSSAKRLEKSELMVVSS